MNGKFISRGGKGEKVCMALGKDSCINLFALISRLCCGVWSCRCGDEMSPSISISVIEKYCSGQRTCGT